MYLKLIFIFNHSLLVTLYITPSDATNPVDRQNELISVDAAAEQRDQCTWA